MSKTWTFIGGMIAGVVSVFAAATAAVALEDKQRTDVILDEDDTDTLLSSDEHTEDTEEKDDDVTEPEVESKAT